VAPLAPLDLKVHLALPEQLDQQVHVEQLDQQDQQDQQDHKDNKVLLV
jgi:hypothetical protein